MPRSERRIRQTPAKCGDIEEGLRGPQRGIRRGSELGGCEFSGQRLRVIQMGNGQRDAGGPLFRAPLRSRLSRRKRPQPVGASSVDRAEDDPSRQRIVPHEEQRSGVRRGRVVGSGTVAGVVTFDHTVRRTLPLDDLDHAEAARVRSRNRQHGLRSGDEPLCRGGSAPPHAERTRHCVHGQQKERGDGQKDGGKKMGKQETIFLPPSFCQTSRRQFSVKHSLHLSARSTHLPASV